MTLNTLRFSLAALVITLAFAGASLGIAHAQNVPGSTNPGNVPGSTNPGNVQGSTSGCTNQTGALQNPLQGICSLPALLHAILQAVVELGSILLAMMLVWVGFLFVVAQGNPEKLSSARSALIWTLIGGLILLGAESISLVIQETVKQL